MIDEELMDRGYQAEQAKPYLESLIAQAKDAIYDRIIALSPDQTMMFTIHRSQMLCFADILNLVEGDITEGKRAILRLQGNPPEGKGIL